MSDTSERPLVLVVERDRTVRELQAHFLGQGGFAVEFAETGELAADWESYWASLSFQLAR